MSAETLRKAAKVLRKKANDAILATGDGAWLFTGIGWNDVQGTTYTISTDDVRVGELGIEEQAIYVATMYPVVGCAVAALLDAVAEDAESNDEFDGFDPYVTIPGYGPALTVARLILGGAS